MNAEKALATNEMRKLFFKDRFMRQRINNISNTKTRISTKSKFFNKYK
jgi:hypothetical protein